MQCHYSSAWHCATKQYTGLVPFIQFAERILRARVLDSGGYSSMQYCSFVVVFCSLGVSSNPPWLERRKNRSYNFPGYKRDAEYFITRHCLGRYWLKGPRIFAFTAPESLDVLWANPLTHAAEASTNRGESTSSMMNDPTRAPSRFYSITSKCF